MHLSIDTPTLALIVTLLGNAFALTWGAAKFSAAVRHLTSWADKADEKLVNHESRISQIEGVLR